MTEAARRRRELFIAALDRPVAERPGFLLRECADPALRAEILELLAIEPPEAFLQPPDLAADTRLRSTFGPYRVEVFDVGPGRHLARHGATGDLVEIEVHPLPPEADDDRATAFVRTAHRINELRHRGNVAVHEHGRLAAEFWFARNRVEGHDLAAEIERQCQLDAHAASQPTILPRIGSREYVQALLVVFETVVDVLREAHRIGIAHGDLTAARILLDREGRGHVCGFGIAALSGRPASPQLDLAAVCTLLHEALADAVDRQPPGSHTHQATAAERVVLHALMLRLDLAARRPYADAASLLADLQRVRGGRAPVAQGWPHRLAGWLTGRRPGHPARRPADERGSTDHLP